MGDRSKRIIIKNWSCERERERAPSVPLHSGKLLLNCLNRLFQNSSKTVLPNLVCRYMV
jgi:hypothetical protein